MRVLSFLSYSHDDKNLAGSIKGDLETYGLDVFVAHDDIVVTAKWENTILRKLRKCEVFIALLTTAFDESDWAHQEIGIAAGRNPSPIMVPISAEKIPVGFMAKYHAIRIDPSRIDEGTKPIWGAQKYRLTHLNMTCAKIIKAIAAKDKGIASNMRGFLIDKLTEVDTFDGAGTILWKLFDIGGFTPREINRLLRAASKNDQVYKSNSADYHLRRLTTKYKGSIRRTALNSLIVARGGDPGDEE